MSKTHEYLNYLNEQIGIAPANSQEELQAAQTISEVMDDHGVNPVIEEFSTPTGNRAMKPIFTLLMLLALIFAGFGGVAGTIAVLVTIACCILLILGHYGKSPFKGMGPVVQSQNVVAFHQASGSKVMKGNRPIVIIAHYDTPRVNPILNQRGGASFYAWARRASIICLYAVAVVAFIQLLGFVPPVARRIFWFIGILAALVPVLLAIADIASRNGDCTDGANDNKSSVAALLSILNNVHPGPDVALDAEAVRAQQEEAERAREAARQAREEEEAAAAEAEAAAKAKAEEERLARYKRHGVDTLKSLGMLPEDCMVVYEDPHVTIEEPAQQDEAEKDEETTAAPAETTAAEEKTEVRSAEPEAEPEKPAKKGLGSIFGRVREAFEEKDKAAAEDEHEQFEDRPEEAPAETSAPSADGIAPEEATAEDKSDKDATIQSEPVKVDAEEPIDTEGKPVYEMSEDNPYRETDFKSRQQKLWPDVLDADWEPIDTTTPDGIEGEVPPSAASSVGEPHLRSESEVSEEDEEEEAPASEHAEDEPNEPEPEAPAEEPAHAEEGEDVPFVDEAPVVQEVIPVEEPAVPAETLPAEAASTTEATTADATQETAAQPAEEPSRDEASYLAHSSEDVASYVDSIFAQEIDAANLSKAPAKDDVEAMAPEAMPVPKAAQPEAKSASPSASAARVEEPRRIGVDDSGVLAALASLDAEVPAPKDEEDEEASAKEPAANEPVPEAQPAQPDSPAVASDLSSITPVVTESEIEDLSGWEPEEEPSSGKDDLGDTDVFGAIQAEEDEHEENGDTAVFPAYEENDPLRYVSKSTPLDAYFEEIEEPEEGEGPESEDEEAAAPEAQDEPADDTASSDIPAEMPEPSSDAEPAEDFGEDDYQDFEDEELEGEDEEDYPSGESAEEEPEPASEEEDDGKALSEEDAASFDEELESLPVDMADEPAADSGDYEAEQPDEEEKDVNLDHFQAGPKPLYPDVLDAELIEEIEEPESAGEDAEEAEAADLEESDAIDKEAAEETVAEEPEPEPASTEPAPEPEPPACEAEEEAAEAVSYEAGETEAMQAEVVSDEADALEPEAAAPEEDLPEASADEHPIDEMLEDAAGSEGPDAEEPALEQPAAEPDQTISDGSDLGLDDEGPDDAEAVPEDSADVEADAELIEDEPAPAPREKPAMPDDPEWGKTTFRPAISQMSRRVILNDLPDPSHQSVDPFSEGSEENEPHETPEVSMKSSTPQPVAQQSQFDVITPETLDRIAKESQREQKRHHFGRKPNQGRHFAASGQDVLEASGIRVASPSRPHHGSNNGWKGGATPKEELRDPQYGEGDEPEGINGYELDPERAAAVRAQAKAEAEAQARAQAKAEADARAQAEALAQQEREATIADEELRDAVLSMNDEDLTCHDIWFVAAGGSQLDHAGVEAFLEEHRKELRGAFLINLDCVGAGTPTVLTEEGLDEPKRADRRLVRMFQNIAQDFGLPLAKKRYNLADTDATPALRKHVRSVTIMGMDENGLPAYSQTLDDVAQNVNGDQVADIVQMVTELLRQS